MARIPRALPIALLRVDTTSQLPLYQQLYSSLKRAILHGRLKPGALLPSTRAIASELRVSRNTVTAAFEQLRAEGYLEGRIGSGTRVKSSLPHEILRPTTRGHSRERSAVTARVQLSPWGAVARKLGSELRRFGAPSPTESPRAFQLGVPAIDQFPADVWARLVARWWRHAPRQLLQYGDPAGLPALRDAIASYASANRGVRCDAEQVIIVAGSQQGLYLAARLLVEPGATVWIEDPAFPGARSTFGSLGLSMTPVAVDDEGLTLDLASSHASGRRRKPRLIYVTPSHQFPLGVTMSLSRRLALLEFAGRTGAWILEDDYGSEYVSAGRPISSLQGLTETNDNRVIYFGTFSKVLVPALRLGYVVVPKSLVATFRAARALIDMHSPSIDQAALAEFITTGHLERHVRRLRAVYQERLALLAELARRQLAGLLDLGTPVSGLHLIGWLPKATNDRAAATAAAGEGATVVPLSTMAIEHQTRPGLVMNYGGFTDDQIRAGVAALRRALSRHRE